MYSVEIQLATYHNVQVYNCFVYPGCYMREYTIHTVEVDACYYCNAVRYYLINYCYLCVTNFNVWNYQSAQATNITAAQIRELAETEGQKFDIYSKVFGFEMKKVYANMTETAKSVKGGIKWDLEAVLDKVNIRISYQQVTMCLIKDNCQP